MTRGSTTDRPLAALRAVLERVGLGTREDVRAIGGGLAAVTVCLLAAVRIGVNAPPTGSAAGLQVVHSITSVAGVVVPAVIAVAAGVIADSESALVGLVAAGVFSSLALLAPAGAVAASGVLAVAALLVVAPTTTRRTRTRLAFGALIVAGVALSLGATTGVLSPDARILGTTVALLALVVAPVATRASTKSLLAGLGVALAVIAGTSLVPFVTGATVLAVGAAVDPHFAVLAAGLGGSAAVVVEGVRRRRIPLAAGGLLVVAAGVPATVPRALAVVLGAHLVLVSTRTDATPTGPHRGDAT